MRVAGKHARSKVEGPRLVGFGLMIAGSMALVLSVAGAAGAGSGSTPAAEPAHHTCTVVYKEDGPMAQVLQSVANTNCQNTTTTWHTTSCTCSTTTTLAPTIITEVAGTTITIESSTTAAAPTTTAATTTTAAPTIVAGIVGGTTTTLGSNVVPQGGTSTTVIHVKPLVTSLPTVGPQIAVKPATAQLPFTGSNTMPLAAAGIVMVATGFGLSRRKRRLAN